MSWKEILEKRMKARRQILFSKDDDAIMSLNLLIDDMPRRAVILWALELAEETVILLETKYPFEERPRNALTMTRMWASSLKSSMQRMEIWKQSAKRPSTRS